MRFTKFFALALGVAFLVVWGANGQPPPGGPKGIKGPKGAKGPNTNSEQLLDDLTMTDAQKGKARDILRAHDEKMRQAARQARTELLAQMKDVLSAADYKTFKDEIEQVPLLPTIPPVLRTIAADELIERLMAYDKNGDGKITKDELPERMHGLIDQGDRNGDGALDRDEIRRLAERGPPGPGGPPGVRPPGGPGGPPRPAPPPPPAPRHRRSDDTATRETLHGRNRYTIRTRSDRELRLGFACRAACDPAHDAAAHRQDRMSSERITKKK